MKNLITKIDIWELENGNGNEKNIFYGVSSFISTNVRTPLYHKSRQNIVYTRYTLFYDDHES